MSRWYRKKENRVLGPYSTDEMRVLRRAGKLNRNDRVRNGDLGEWVLAETELSIFPNESIALSEDLRLTNPNPTDPEEGTEVETTLSDGPGSTRGEKPEQPPLKDEQVLREDEQEDNRALRVLIGSLIGGLFFLLILLLLWFWIGKEEPSVADGNGGRGDAGGLTEVGGDSSDAGTGDSSHGTVAGQEPSSKPAGGPSSPKTNPQSQDGRPESRPKETSEKPVDPPPTPPTKKRVVTFDPIDPSTPTPVVSGKPLPQGPPVPTGGPNGRSVKDFFGGGGGGGGGVGGSTDFFGVRAKGNKIVYVVDSSGSMAGPRFTKACEELKKSIHGLKSRQQFYVYFFSSISFPMFYPAAAAPKLMKATKKNKEQLERWIDGFQPSGGTEPEASMLGALDLHPDVIYLLSDGGFSQPTVDAIRDKNNGEVVINTIGFVDPGGEAQLRPIAEKNKGEYRFVP